MPVFRKLPVLVEAYPFDGTWDSVRYLKPGPNDIKFIDRGGAHGGQPNQLDIRTLNGTVTANVGEWIVRGIQGEFYPVHPDIFALTYEPA